MGYKVFLKSIFTHGEFRSDNLRLLFLMKDNFKYLFGAFWLFGIANTFPISLCPILIVVYLKPSGGLNSRFDKHQSVSKVLVNREWFRSGDMNSVFKGPPLPRIWESKSSMFCVKMNMIFWKISNFEFNSILNFSLLNVLYNFRWLVDTMYVDRLKYSYNLHKQYLLQNEFVIKRGKWDIKFFKITESYCYIHHWFNFKRCKVYICCKYDYVGETHILFSLYLPKTNSTPPTFWGQQFLYK